MTDDTDAIRTEAMALRHVFHQPADERGEMLKQLESASMPLKFVITHARKQQGEGPAAEWRDIWAGIMPKLEKHGIQPAARDVLEGAVDPSAAAVAYRDTIALAGENRQQRLADTIRRIAEEKKPGWEREVDNLLENDRAKQIEEEDLMDGWDAYRKSMNGPDVEKHEAVMLDPLRGAWAKLLNSWLGSRGGLMPGKALLIGGAAGGGKTSLASAFAWDALTVGCPVTLYQLELGRFSAVEYLLRQNPAGVPPIPIFDNGLPPEWRDLLEVPAEASPQGEDAVDAVKRLARRAEKLRGRGGNAHACNGLMVVDYVQLFAKSSSGEAFHEALAATVSRLVKTAANNGTCLVLASQVNKNSQKEALDRLAFAGADLARMPDVAVTIERATCEGGKFTAAVDGQASELNGYEARMITRQKDRGLHVTGPGTPDRTAGVWVRGGTLRDRPAKVAQEKADETDTFE